ncbi:GNAT family N-acetyltransferase, partial [Vibrio lentus]
PHIYTSIPSEEDRYALFRLNATLFRRDVSTTIIQDDKVPYQKLRKRMIKKASKAGLILNEVNDFSSYWNLLSEVLVKEHGVKPVHTFEEIDSLRRAFPNNIVCHSISYEGKVIAGVVLFITENVIHCQYIAASDDARKIGALDYLIDHLINEVYQEVKYFDFGTSNEDSGRKLNEGLIFQKEGFGARAVVHDFYEIEIND